MADAHYAFAGGGTGGHLFPGLAVAAALRRLEPAARITFFTTSRPLDRELLSRTDYVQIPQDVRPLSLRPWRWPGFWFAWRQSLAEARRRFDRDPPAAVLGLGGYAAGPPVVVAAQLGIRSAILNPDLIPGRANRYLAARVDCVAAQWPGTQRFLPRRATLRVTGCPIRAEFATATRARGLEIFSLDPDRRVLLVTGASQGARSINEAVRLAWPRFLAERPEWQLLHLAGAADAEPLESAYAAAGAPARVLAFTHDMPAALAAADLVISRAGASTLAEITALGKPAILMPYPFHRDRHQHANAGVLVEAGAAVMVEDLRDGAANAEPLLAAMHRLADPATRQFMADAAGRLGRLDAADAVARWMTGGSP